MRVAYTVILIPDDKKPGYWKWNGVPYRFPDGLFKFINVLSRGLHAKETQELHGHVERERGRIFRYPCKNTDGPCYEMIWEENE